MKRLVVDILAFEYEKAFGYQEYVTNLLEYFYTHRSAILFDQIIIVCLDSQRRYFLKYSDRIQIVSYVCNSGIKRMLIQTLIPLYLGLKKQDLVLFTANYSSLFKRCNHILVIHDLLFKRKYLFPYYKMRLQRAFYLPISIKLADKIIAISKFTASDIEYYYPVGKSKTCVIYNFFNFKKFPLNQKTNTPQGAFISVCSAAYHKNTIVVIDAFKNYCLAGGTYSLILVGSLKKGTWLFDQVEQLDITIKERICIYNKISNATLAELYQKSNAYISASRFEGLGMPIVEAMYFNLPVILSNYPVFQEVSMGKGLYFDPLNSAELAEKMMYIQTCKPTFSYSAMMNVYSEQQTSEKYIQLINSFI